MRNLPQKIRLIFIPYLLTVAGFLILYTLLHWLLVIQWEVVDLKEEVINLWIPFATAMVLPFLLLYRRAKLLRYKKDNGHMGLLAFAGFSMLAPVLITQVYLQVATGKLTDLTTIEQYAQRPATRYYTLQRYFVDKGNASWFQYSSVSGKNKRDLTFHFYVAAPLVEDASDTLMAVNTYWFGKHYSKTISNRISPKEKEEVFQSFGEEVDRDFQSPSFSRFTYLEKAGNTDDHDRFFNAISKTTLYSGQPIIFTGEANNFASRTGHKLAWIVGSLAIGITVVFLIILFVPLDEEAVARRDHARDEEARTIPPETRHTGGEVEDPTYFV